jgi:hypothetical protein
MILLYKFIFAKLVQKLCRFFLPPPTGHDRQMSELNSFRSLNFIRKIDCCIGFELDFGMKKNIPYKGNIICHKTCLRRYESHFEKLEIRFICSIFLLLDPDLHFQYGSGSGRAKSMRIRIRNTGCSTSSEPDHLLHRGYSM